MNASDKHISSSPIENLVFDDPPPGKYKIWVENMTARVEGATPFTVRLTREVRFQSSSGYTEGKTWPETASTHTRKFLGVDVAVFFDVGVSSEN